MATLSYANTIDRAKLDAFCARWPCHGIAPSIWRVWCRWDGRGDLVELLVTYRNGRQAKPEAYDGPAMVALISDAQAEMHPEHAAERSAR